MAVMSLEELGIPEIDPMANDPMPKKAGKVKSLEELGIPTFGSSQPQQSDSEAGESLSVADRALQYGRGLASVPSTAIDLTNKYIATPTLRAAGSIANIAGKGAGYLSENVENALKKGSEAAYDAADYYSQSDVTNQVQQGFSDLAGKDLTPKDTTGKILNTAGEFSFPVSNVIKGAKTTGQVLGAISKHLGVSGSGAAALEGTKDYRLTDEGTSGRMAEDFLISLSGMALGDKGLSASKQKIMDSTENLLERLLNRADRTTVKATASEKVGVLKKGAAKVLSLGANPNLEVNAAARAEGVDLPFEVALGGKFHKFLANTGLKSLFVTKAYNNVIEHADRDMINAVKIKINEINPMQFDGELASINAKDFLQGEKTAIKGESKKLYDRQASLLNETDKAKPLNSFDFANKILPEISPASPSDDMRFVATRISRIGKDWGWLPDLTKFEDSPELIKKIKEAWGKGEAIKDIAAKDIDIQIKALKRDLKHERDIPGVKNLLNGFISALEKDLGTVANKEFLEARSGANTYFRENIGERIRTNMAESILKGEMPKEAFTYMQSAPEIRQLKKIMGDSEASNEIMTSLKRAKLEQILVSNIIDSSGTITYSKLSNLFNKSPEKQALLRELLGGQYAGMKKLADVSQGFVTAGKEFGNASRTTLAARDINGIKEMLTVLGNTAATLVGSTSLHGIGLGATIEPLAITALSWVASDKQILNTALKYAEAAQKGKSGDKKIFGTRLIKQASLVLGKNYLDKKTEGETNKKKVTVQ